MTDKKETEVLFGSKKMSQEDMEDNVNSVFDSVAKKSNTYLAVLFLSCREQWSAKFKSLRLNSSRGRKR